MMTTINRKKDQEVQKKQRKVEEEVVGKFAAATFDHSLLNALFSPTTPHWCQAEYFTNASALIQDLKALGNTQDVDGPSTSRYGRESLGMQLSLKDKLPRATNLCFQSDSCLPSMECANMLLLTVIECDSLDGDHCFTF